MKDRDYTKIRELEKILKNSLDSIKINTILKYLERSNQIEIDYEGNIIWIKKQKEQITFSEKAVMDKNFIDYVKDKRD